MRYLILPLVVYLVAIVETSLGDVFRIGEVMPDGMAIVAMLWVLHIPSPRAFLVAGLVGLASDLIAPGTIGLGAIGFLLIGFGLCRLRARWRLDQIITRQLAVAGSVTLISSYLALIAWGTSESPLPLVTLLLRAVGVGIYSAGISLPILLVLDWTGRRSTHVPLRA